MHFPRHLCLVSLLITGTSSLWRCKTTTSLPGVSQKPKCDTNVSRQPCACMEDKVIDSPGYLPCDIKVELREIARFYRDKKETMEIPLEYGLVGRPKGLNGNLTKYEDWKNLQISKVLDVFRRDLCDKDDIELKNEETFYEHNYEPVEHNTKTFSSSESDKIVFQLQFSCQRDEDPHPMYQVKFEIFKELEIKTSGVLQGIHKCTLHWVDSSLNEKDVRKWCPS